jgi:hypothetical protein
LSLRDVFSCHLQFDPTDSDTVEPISLYQVLVSQLAVNAFGLETTSGDLGEWQKIKACYGYHWVVQNPALA